MVDVYNIAKKTSKLPAVSDLMNIFSSSDSYDTWSRSRDDYRDDDDYDEEEEDDETSSWPVRYLKDGNFDTQYDANQVRSQTMARRRGKEKKKKNYRYSHDENSIVETSYSSSTTGTIEDTPSTILHQTQNLTRNTRTSPNTSEEIMEDLARQDKSRGRNPFDNDSDNHSTPSDEIRASHQQLTSFPKHYPKGYPWQSQQQRHTPPSPQHSMSASSNPSDEHPQTLSPIPRHWPTTAAAPQQSTGTVFDDSNQSMSHPLSPVNEEDDALSEIFSDPSFRPTYSSSSQPSDEHDSIDSSAREAQQQLRRTFEQKRDVTQDISRRNVELLQQQQQQQRVIRRKQQDLNPFADSSPTSSAPKHLSNSTGEAASTDSEAGVDNKEMNMDQHYPLHDLCSEATSPDDVAWRNALYLLSVQPELATVAMDGWSPLHVCCVGSTPPPDFMVRAILYCNSSCARAFDKGGRLPLHMIAASSAESAIMQLLVEEYPQAIYTTDARGFTPLHMLLRNEEVGLTMDRVRILLGQTIPRNPKPTKDRIVQRRGDHLALNVEQLNRMTSRPDQVDQPLDPREQREQQHEMQMSRYPNDVKASFENLAKWKRKQKRLQSEGGEEALINNIELVQTRKDDETNPAAIAAPPSMQLPLHMAIRRKDPAEESFVDEEEDNYIDVGDPPANRNEVMRVIVSAYPRGLVSRDSNGHTPLMIALLNQDCLPSLELLQLLLGMRTAGYESPPLWADDLPLHESLEGRCINPAMVSATDTNQLPLHVAAEEMPSFYPAIESIHASYPGAVHVQDARGRTPLHMALRNYQKIQPDPKVVTLLLTEKVAQIRDDDGFLPFDLLVGGAHNLPKSEPMPSRWEDSTFDPSSVYKKFFLFVVMQAPCPRNRAEAQAFLQRLRMLPPWLRRQACTVGFIQDLLVEEVSSMGNCAFILFSGMLWVVLLTCFRLQMDMFTKTGALGSQYAPVIYCFSSFVLFCQLVNWCLSASLSVFVSQCLRSIWPFVDLSSALVTIAATVMIQSDSSDTKLVASLGTAATGLLWFSLIGFFARWWHGMALFMGRTLRMSHVLVCPLLAAGALIVGFAQMFLTYNLTISQEECSDVLGGRSLCSIREAFITVYLMILGTPLVDTDDEASSSLNSGSVVLISLFTSLLVLFVVSLLISVVSEATRIDLDDIALGYFWEPKLNFAFIMDDLTTSFSRLRINHATQPSDGIRKKHKLKPTRSLDERFTSFLEDGWTVVDYAVFGGERRRGNMWYVSCCSSKASPLVIWPLRLFFLIIVPIWLVLGLATCGVLWPPQVRRWLFHPSRSSVRMNNEANAAAEYSADQVRGMRGEVLQLKTMSYERSIDVKQELRELKHFVYAAMKDK